MAYTKPLVTTTVTLHDESTAVFADSITNGNVYRDGSTAKQQLLHGETVAAKATVSGNRVDMVIPYHSVIKATVAVADSAEQEEPEDAFCK